MTADAVAGAAVPVEGYPVRQTVLRSLSYGLRRWRLVTTLLASSVVSALATGVTPLPMQVVVDNVIGGRPLKGTVATIAHALPGADSRSGLAAYAIGCTVVLFGVSWLNGLVYAYARAVAGQQITYDVAGDLFEALQRLSLRFHSMRGTGDVIRRVSVDSQCFATIVLGVVVPVVSSVVTLVTMLYLMWHIDSGLVPYAFAVVPLMFLALRRFMPVIVERSTVEQDVEGRLWTTLEQTLSAAPVVQSFVGEERASAEFEASAQRLLHANVASTQAQLLFRIGVGGAAAAVTALIFWVGAGHVLDGSLTLGGVLVFLAYLGSFYGPIDVLVSTHSTTSSVAGSVRRVLEVLTTRPDVEDRHGARFLKRVRGHIAFDRATFSYGDAEPAVADASFEVQPGETVAIVGPSGAGKTTLVSLVGRFFDVDSGRVLVDGHDVRDLRIRNLRSHVALVLQDPFLFPISIADNIAYGRPLARREVIEEAARAANAHEFISALPHGYDTIVGERGATLSGGQRQRISIARALLKDAPILILDEPTSALDLHSEQAILGALDRLMQGRTTLIIAHRLSTIRNADKIVVMDHGRVVEVGTHRELMARGGEYARLHASHRGSRRRVMTLPT